MKMLLVLLGACTASAFHVAAAPRSSLPSLRPAPAMSAAALPGVDSTAARLSSGLEVTVSKIFPAGAGWQLASVVAEGMGHTTGTLPFFALVGLGDLSGVFAGHLLYQYLRAKATGGSVDMKTERQVASLLGGAAFFSGFTWQVALNTCNALGYTFTQSLVGVGVACTGAFFCGLRVMRRLLSDSMEAVEGPTYKNMKSDVGLSAAIGGAVAGFVGTDTSFGAANWLAPLVGIKSGFSTLRAVVVAGLSTSLGFMATMLVQALALPSSQCWIDGDYVHPRAG